MSKCILYVARDKTTKSRYCRGSLVCMRLIDTFELDPIITIQDTDVLHRDAARIPEWLAGTPTLICRTSFRVFKGIDAIEHVATIAVERSPIARAAGGHLERRLPPISDGLATDQADGTALSAEDDRGWPSAKHEKPTAQSSTSVKPLRDVLLADEDDDANGVHLQNEGLSTPPANNLDFGELVDPETLNAAQDGKISEADVKRFMSSRGM